MCEDEPGHRSCSEHITIERWSRGAGDGIFYRTASGGRIPDGGVWQFQGHGENGLLRSLNGSLTGVHNVLCSAAEIACKRRQDFCLGHDGGHMIPDQQQNSSGE